ncbi:MAG: sulfurtransferase, partial [Methanoregulaceae archaeon]|nr:sulfurtransferase [Methanoregulaceae archaeon]
MNDRVPEEQEKNIVSWVTPEWLADHLDEPGLTIIDCRKESHAYIHEHIPGAVYVHEAMLRMHIGRSPLQWIPAEAAQVLFANLGIEQDKPVVVYSECTIPNVSSATMSDGLEQALVAYTLARFGCRNVMLLDGGLAGWRSGRYPVTDSPGITRASAFTVDVQVDFLIGYDECKKIKDNDGIILLDTRPQNLYEGQGPWSRPGHIPGAVNLPVTWLLTDHNPTLLKPDKEIRRILASSGITPEKTVICSCGTGRLATAVFLILKYFLIYPDVLMYEAGFT